MLVLTRGKGERIFIGEGDGLIVLTVVDIDKMRVRIGIDAPRDFTVDREEVFKAKQAGTTPGTAHRTTDRGASAAAAD